MRKNSSKNYRSVSCHSQLSIQRFKNAVLTENNCGTSVALACARPKGHQQTHGSDGYEKFSDGYSNCNDSYFLFRRRSQGGRQTREGCSHQRCLYSQWIRLWVRCICGSKRLVPTQLLQAKRCKSRTCGPIAPRSDHKRDCNRRSVPHSDYSLSPGSATWKASYGHASNPFHEWRRHIHGKAAHYRAIEIEHKSFPSLDQIRGGFFLWEDL